MAFWIDTEDWHTAGEPFRIVPNLPDGSLPSSRTVAQRRLDILAAGSSHPLNRLRESLCHEPRGHADMYGGFITPPDDDKADFGVLFWHKDGFSTACGHGTIALGYWALMKGIVKTPVEDQEAKVVIDVPSGRVTAWVTLKDGKPVHADFYNVISYPLAQALRVNIASRGGMQLKVDLAFSGAVYVSIDAEEQLKMKVEPENTQEFIRLGREIKAALGTRAHHGEYDCYGVIFYQEEDGERDRLAKAGEKVIRQKNITIFADGQVDRSPCGSGTSARLALLNVQGRSGKLIHRSIIGSEFEAEITSEQVMDGAATAVSTVVRGEARLCGKMSFFIDPDEPIYPGFLLR